MTVKAKWCIVVISFLIFVSSLVLFLNVRAKYSGISENIQFSSDELVYKNTNIVFYDDGKGTNIKTTTFRESLLVKIFLDTLDVPYELTYELAEGYARSDNNYKNGVAWEFFIARSVGKVDIGKKIKDVPKKYLEDDFVLLMDTRSGLAILHVFDCRNVDSIFESGSISVGYRTKLSVMSFLINNDKAREQFMETTSEEDLIPEKLPYDEDKKVQYMPIEW